MPLSKSSLQSPLMPTSATATENAISLTYALPKQPELAPTPPQTTTTPETPAETQQLPACQTTILPTTSSIAGPQGRVVYEPLYTPTVQTSLDNTLPILTVVKNQGAVYQSYITFTTLQSSDMVIDNNNVAHTHDNIIQIQDNIIQTQDNTLQTQDNIIQTQDNIIQTQNNTPQTQDNSVQTQDNSVLTHHNTLQTQVNTQPHTIDHTQDNTVQTLDYAVQTQDNTVQTLDYTVQTQDNTTVQDLGQTTVHSLGQPIVQDLVQTPEPSLEESPGQCLEETRVQEQGPLLDLPDQYQPPPPPPPTVSTILSCLTPVPLTDIPTYMSSIPSPDISSMLLTSTTTSIMIPTTTTTIPPSLSPPPAVPSPTHPPADMQEDEDVLDSLSNSLDVPLYSYPVPDWSKMTYSGQDWSNLSNNTDSSALDQSWDETSQTLPLFEPTLDFESLMDFE